MAMGPFWWPLRQESRNGAALTALPTIEKNRLGFDEVGAMKSRVTSHHGMAVHLQCSMVTASEGSQHGRVLVAL
eukprot:5941575-Amphidinium_carterae.2